MKIILKLEELVQFLLGIYLFGLLDYPCGGFWYYFLHQILEW